MKMGLRRRIATAAAVAGVALGASPAGAQAACSTAPPASNFAGQTDFSTDAGIAAAFTAARAAEGCNVPMTLPAGFDQMTAQQQQLWLFNNEREVRGLPDLVLDPTLLSQISYNHSLEMATYNFTDHPSPINAPGGDPYSGRIDVNPAFGAAGAEGENIAWGYGTALATFAYLYQDSGSQWGHRKNIFNANYNTVGIGIIQNSTTSTFGNYYTDDFLGLTGYTPPAAADTGAPTMGPVTYTGGTATVTGVADSPANVNDLGANPLSAAITQVSFYTNNIVETGQTFNTVAATQTAPGTWTAPITVNPGDVLHAVAVDGSGNFTDTTAAPGAMALTAGANTVALPAATGQTATAGATTGQVLGANALTRARAGETPAVTPTAAALVRSIDHQLGRGAARAVKVYADGHWRVYTPGRSRNFPLYTGEGVVLTLSRSGHWRSTSSGEPAVAPTLHLHPGWDFVSVPYPVIGMTCHATRLEIDHRGSHVLEISVGTEPNTGFIMKPHDGHWGNDLKLHIGNQKGFWVHITRAATWTPSPIGYRTGRPGIG